MTPIIEVPRGMVIYTRGSRTQLSWNSWMQPEWKRAYTKAQIFVDNEVLRLSEPFTPLRTGTLIKTGTMGTDPGSGEVIWIAPYSRSQYYSARKPGSKTGPDRGPFWFERMKARHGKKIVEGARRLAGRG